MSYSTCRSALQVCGSKSVHYNLVLTRFSSHDESNGGELQEADVHLHQSVVVVDVNSQHLSAHCPKTFLSFSRQHSLM